MKAIISIALFVSFCSGCIAHYSRNEEAERKWIEAPPEDEKIEGAVVPPKTESNIFYLAPGAFTGLGVSKPNDEKSVFNINLGAELTLGYARGKGFTSNFINDKEFAPPCDFTLALKLGWTALDRVWGVNGPAYAEAIYGIMPSPGFFFGFGAGWIGQLEDERHGFVITGYLGPFYMRIQHLVSDRTEVLWGLRFEVPIMFIFAAP